MKHATMMATLIGGVLAAGPAWADFTKSQELTILTVRSAYLAAQSCPYAVDVKTMRAVLSRKGLTQADVSSGTGSELLTDDLAADVERYRSDTAAACDQAWASFGPDGPMKGLLRSK